jgi:hypothetical protein
MKMNIRKLTVALVAATMLATPLSAEDPLAEGFQNPPQAARPRVWWHWMGGNVTAEGAALDLAWMKRVGIGGVHAFSGQLREQKVVDEPAPFMSPIWQDVFRRSLATLHDAGMELTIAGSPGWSQTGGPWVTPADAMKKYVWSETLADGGRPIRAKLARPPAAPGVFQGAGAHGATSGTTPELYGDSFVIAFPTPAAEIGVQPAYTSSGGAIDLSPISAGDLSSTVKLPIVPGSSSAWVQAQFPQPTQISAFTLGVEAPVETGVEIQASDDGQAFRTLLRVPARSINTIDIPAPQRTFAFAPATARFFRATLLAPAVPEPLPGTPSFLPRAKPVTEFSVSRLTFERGARLDRFEAKAGFEPAVKAIDAAPPAALAAGVIPKGRVVDLTRRMTADGRLDWTPPAGKWTILRFGWSLTGHKNGPAEPSATGLEVDKLDPEAVKRYLNSYLELYARATGGQLGKEGIQNLLTDSWEAGVQNWTPTLAEAFRARRGYDLLPFLPVLAGRIVDSTETSERFLWDFRQTLKELVAENHHGVLARELHARGMGFYSEANGDTPRAIADGMTLKARSDIPTAEYWYRPFAAGPGQPSLKADLEEAASAAHVYGKPLAAAEALTVAAGDDPWSFSPAMLKPVADEIFARGINRILIHESHLQPLVDKKPGLAMLIFGQYFNRNETWAEEAKPWVDYLARTSHMLQQGRYVADVAYFYGEEKNLTELFRTRFNTDVPSGYRYDYINPEALLTLLSVKDGQIATPSGMRYRILYMPAHVTRYTVPALRKLRDLVAAGAIVAGPKPIGGLGLADSDAEVRRLADEIWGTGAASTGGHNFGQGRVYATSELQQVLAAERIAPDVRFSGASVNSQLLTLHRRTDDADIYFVSNQQPRTEVVEASFRVAGKRPELWRAETGATDQLTYRIDGDRVAAPLRLAPHEAVFVVFRRKADQQQWTAPTLKETTLATLQGPWPVSFEPGRGAPPTATFDTLVSWPQVENPGIRHFSGAVTYSKRFDAPATWLKRGQRVHLDLGKVHELASVSVNGKPVGTTWHAPYRVDITDALRRGENRLEIKVVNLWPNRLIGDKQAGVTPITFAPSSFYTATSPLLPSGLLGPVRLVGVARQEASQ